jgi:hypothetical protein
VATIEDLADHLVVDVADVRVLVGWHVDESDTVRSDLPPELCEALHRILDPHGERTAPAPLYWPGHPWGSYPDDFDRITGMSPTQGEGELPTLDEW